MLLSPMIKEFKRTSFESISECSIEKSPNTLELNSTKLLHSFKYDFLLFYRYILPNKHDGHKIKTIDGKS